MLTKAQGKCHRLRASQAHNLFSWAFPNVLPGPVRVCLCVSVAKRQNILKPDFCFSLFSAAG